MFRFFMQNIGHLILVKIGVTIELQLQGNSNSVGKSKSCDWEGHIVL